MAVGRVLWRLICRFSTWNFLGRVVLVATVVGITLFVWKTPCTNGREYPTTSRDLKPLNSQRKPTTEPFQTTSHEPKSLQKRPSICPDRDVLKSSKVTRLGRYPSQTRFLAIGIASVARPAGELYLLQTTQSLLDNTSQSDKDSVQIVIFLADLEKAPRSTVKEKLSRKFGEHIEQGLLTVIETFPEFYPELINIKEKYGDSENRRTWRSKENVDNAFVMCYCKDFSQYYIHLEDDVRSSPSFLPKLKNFIHDQPYPNWVMLDVAQQGSVAKLYQSRDLENAAMFYYLLYDEMPIDWLMNHWTKIKSVENAESFNKLLASLFEHIGVTSTLAEKAPHVASDLETFFDAYDQKYKGLNPPAIVTSSMSSIEGQPQDAYDKGDGYFWAESSERDDYILIKFNLPTSVQKVFVDTGSYRASDCLLYSGILQASFESSVDGELTNEEDSCGYFNTIGAFQEGKAEITPDESKVVTCLRIVSTEGHANQIFFREIDVWESLTNNKADV